MTLEFLLLGIVLIAVGILWMGAAKDTVERADRVTVGTLADADGYTEICGETRCLPGCELRHPRTGEPVVWYRIENRQPNTNRNDEQWWDTTHLARSKHPFLLDDGTGACLIELRNFSTLGARDETDMGDGIQEIIYSIGVGWRLYASGNFVPVDSRHAGVTHQLEDIPGSPARISTEPFEQRAEEAPARYNKGLAVAFAGGLVVVYCVWAWLNR